MKQLIDIGSESRNDKLASCICERRLWAEVISSTAYRATIGETSAVLFFNSHMFSQLCSMMGLPEVAIRERVQLKAASKIKRNKPQGPL